MVNSRPIVTNIKKSTPAAKILRWRSRIRGAWLRKIGDVEVKSVDDVKRVFASIPFRTPSIWLTFSHPEIKHGLTNDGIPQCNIDQLNPRLMFDQFNPEHFTAPAMPRDHHIDTVYSGDVFNYVSLAMKFTRGKLIKEEDWPEWNSSEHSQLDQYEAQGMFGEPVPMTDKSAVFNLVWTYVVKELDKRKKARCTCDGSTRSGMVRILDYTYANCVDQTSSRIFYAVAAAENLLVYGADVSNAFGEARAPKQGFYIRPDKAFLDWWINKMKRPPIPKGYVVPVLAAM